MSTFTPSKGLEQVARGADVGTWDTPTNSNWGVVDAALGGIVTVTLGGSTVILSAGQYQSNFIIFNGALTANVDVVFPTTFYGPYTVINNCTNAFTYAVQLTTTAGNAIGIPPRIPTDIFNDSANIIFRNLPPIGSYLDIATSTVPLWIAYCTVNPYLNCDGTTFSAVTYPTLAAYLGGTTLPDSRGRSRFTLDQGTARNTGVIAGGTILTGGGDQFSQAFTPTFAGNVLTVTSLNGDILRNPSGLQTGAGSPTGGLGTGSPGGFFIQSQGTPTGTISTIGAGAGQNLPPAYVGGLTLIRAG